MAQNSEIVCQIIAHDSADYREMLELRYRVLREPLDIAYRKAYTPEQIAAEADAVLIVACADGKIIGSLLLRPLDKQTAQMRQVAVDKDWQGRGVGRLLVAFAEQTAAERDICEILLHAREVVLPFYERLGYEPFGELFLEVGLPHREMRKILPGISG